MRTKSPVGGFVLQISRRVVLPDPTLFARAAEALGTGTLDNVTVLRGQASQFADDPSRDVVVVVVNGGTIPADGPASNAESFDHEARITGIIFDARTGEFLRGFMF